MKSGKLNKMATTLMILFLVVSGLMVVQWNAQPVEATEHEDYTYTIEGFIDTEYIEDSIDIKLRSLSTGEIKEESTSVYSYEFSDVNPGWYEIIVPSQVDLEENIAYMEKNTDAFRVPEEENEIPTEIEVETETIDTSLEGNVTDSDGEPIENALVTIENEARNFIHSVHTEMKETEDNETISSFEIDIYNGFEGTLKVEKDGYAPFMNTSVSLVDYERTTFDDVELSKRPVIEGLLYDQTGSRIEEEMDITIYNESTGLFHTTSEGPTFRIRAPAGYSYVMVVNAPGYEPLVIDEDEIGELEENERKWLEKREVAESEPEEIHTDIDFGDSIDELEVETTRNIRNNTRMETLDYPFIGNLAMQIGLALGEEPVELSEDDVEEFKRRLDYTENIKYTPEFITVNDTVYELTDYTAEFSEDFEENLEGSVTDLFEGEISFHTTKTYTLSGEIEDQHIIDLNVEHDRMFGNRRNYTYEMHLREGFERYRGEDTEEHIPNVEVIGHTELMIDPHEVGPEEEARSWITLDVRRSKAGDVEILVDPDREVSRNIFEKDDDEEAHWVIRKGTNVTFRAEYIPVTSEAINYRWTWGDEEEEGEDLTDFSYKFDEVTEGDLELTVEESSGEEISNTTFIMVDDEGPRVPDDTPYIVVDNENISVDTDDPDERTAYVNETEEVEFNATYFEDKATGQVDLYQWNFSDGSGIHDTQEESIMHEFDVPGEYNVSLNVTDPVGNWNDDNNITVRVLDTTKPEGDFSIEWNDNSTYDHTVRIRRETNVTFNGTEIVAHPEEYEGSALDYHWTLVDEDANETLVDEVTDSIWAYDEFTEAGEYTIKLNVTDEPSEFTQEGKGNYEVIEKTIIIERGPVPDLMVHDLVFSEEDVRVGDTVTISINVTNIGELKSENIDTTLTVNGEPVTIDESFYQDGEELNITEIAQGETVTISFEWEPEEDGENTVNVTVVDEHEPEDLQIDNYMEDTLTVNPPAWREYVVYALIPIIIIGVVVGLYFFKDRLTEMLR